MKTKILGLLAVGLLAGPMVANALSVVFDNPNQTVLRPSSGTVEASFSANYICDQGDAVNSVSVNYLHTSSNAILDAVSFVDSFSCGNALRFTFYVPSTADLGLYNLAVNLTDPALFGVTYFDATGILRSVVTAISIDVVGSVPEPGTLALLGLGLAGLGLSRRRKAV